MTRRQGSAALVASPVLIGAVTVLIAIIAVFIAYGANQGLPFVPTYELRAQLPSGAKLVKGNEVRVGGFRVGVVDDIRPDRVRSGDGFRSIAVAYLKLDKTVEPLALDTKVRTRPRSALGLKYVELKPGTGRRTYAAGDVIPLRQASEPLELEDVFSTFDDPTRGHMRESLEGFGTAFAGRGQSLNTAIEALNPFFVHLTPVMQGLSDPGTGLDRFFRELGRAAGQAAPVARTQAVLFTNMADTFAAISADPAALRATIERSPPTLDVAVRSFRVQRPFLSDFTDLSRRLRPAVEELPRSLPAINRALGKGTDVLPRTVALNRRLGGAFRALDELFEEPNTLLALRDLRTTVAVSGPAFEYIAPFQTVCGYYSYFLNALGEHQSQVQVGPTGGGTNQNQNLRLVNLDQPNSLGTVESSRKVDIPPGTLPQDAQDEEGNPLARFYGTPYPPAVDARGNADCQDGQFGYPQGRFSPDSRYGPGLIPGTDLPTSGNGAIVVRDVPGSRGGTYTSRRLGIDSVKDVP